MTPNGLAERERPKYARDMKRLSHGPLSFLSVALLSACAAKATAPAYDFAFPPFDLSVATGDASFVDLAHGPTDFSGVDLTGVDLAAAVADAAVPVDLSGMTGSTVALTLNEVNPRIAPSDEVELLAHGAGDVAGWTLAQGTGTGATTLATLPTLTVAGGDLIVVHLKAATVTTETNATGKAGCVDGTCPSAAWDTVGSAANDLTNSAQVLTLANAQGTIVDGLAFSNGGGAASWPAQLEALQTAGVWDQTPCANGCAKADADALAVATSGSPAVGTTVAGNSMQRIDGVFPSTKAHWTVKASTWGAAN